MSEPNALDNVIGFFNPEAGVKRARARMTLEQARKYDGAAGGRRNQNWHAPSTSADAALGPSLSGSEIVRGTYRETIPLLLEPSRS